MSPINRVAFHFQDSNNATGTTGVYCLIKYYSESVFIGTHWTLYSYTKITD